MSEPATTIQQIARQAGVDLPEERAAALVPSVQAIAAGVRVLAGVDYGDAEPAATFRAPSTERR